MADHVNLHAITTTRPNEVAFTFAAERPLRSVALASTFNSWRADQAPLRHGGADRWQATLPIMPGRHLYKDVLDGEEWVPDPANPWVSEDGQGNSCFTLTEAGELYVRRGEFGPAHPSDSLGDPYAVRDFLAVDPNLGTPEDLRALVDEAHALGLRVILDWTLNRSSIDSPLTKQHPEWFQRDASGRATYHVPGRPAFVGFDFAQPGLRHYLLDAMLHWLTRYDLDGLRFDDSDLVPLDFLRQIRCAGWRRRSRAGRGASSGGRSTRRRPRCC